MSNIYEAPKADLTTEYAKNKGDSEITDAMVDELSRGAKWAKILAILGYIGFGFVVIAVIMLAFSALKIGMVGLLIAAAYGIIGFCIFKISRIMHQYSAAVANLQSSFDAYDLMDSQEHFRRYAKWSALLTIAAFVFSFVAAIGAGSFMAM